MSEELANVLSQDGPEEEPQVNAEESAAAEPNQEAGSDADPQATPTKGEEEPEEQKQKRLGGWQRKIAKLESANEALLEALKRNQPAVESKPVVDEEEPKLPTLSGFNGTVEEYDKLVAEFPAKYAKYAESKRQADAVKQEAEKSAASLNERIAKLPELAEMRKVAAEANMPQRLLNFMGAEAAKKSNGPEVLREALLDAEIRNDLIACDRAQDGQGIASLLNSVSIALRLAAKNSATEKPEPSPLSKAPKPPIPVSKATVADTSLRDDLPLPEWNRRREAQLKAKHNG